MQWCCGLNMPNCNVVVSLLGLALSASSSQKCLVARSDNFFSPPPHPIFLLSEILSRPVKELRRPSIVPSTSPLSSENLFIQVRWVAEFPTFDSRVELFNVQCFPTLQIFIDCSLVFDDNDMSGSVPGSGS